MRLSSIKLLHHYLIDMIGCGMSMDMCGVYLQVTLCYMISVIYMLSILHGALVMPV